MSQDNEDKPDSGVAYPIMKHRNILIGGIIIIIGSSLFYYGWITGAPCRDAWNNYPPDKLIMGSKITQGNFPNGTFWVSNNKSIYLGYAIDLNIQGFHDYPKEGNFPNGTEYAYIMTMINPNLPKWCDS